MTMTKDTRLLTALFVLSAFAAAAAFPGDIKVDGKFVSTATTGTPPLQVDSTTLVPNLNAELLNGLPVSAFTTSVSNVIRVGKAGADFTSIQAAIDSITDAGLDNWYIIQVGPGVYAESVVLKNFVSVIGHEFPATRIEVEGAGDITAITGAALSLLTNAWVIARSTDGGDATAVEVDTPAFRMVRTRIEAETSSPGQAVGLRATGSAGANLEAASVIALNGDVNVGIFIETPAAVSVDDGTVRAESPANSVATNYGIRRVLVSGGSSMSLIDTQVVASSGAVGYGLRSEDGNISVTRSTVSGSASGLGVGIFNGASVDVFSVSDSIIEAFGSDPSSKAIEHVNGEVTVERTTLNGTSALVAVAGGATANIANSRIAGFLSGAGTFNCIGLYDFNMSPVSCP